MLESLWPRNVFKDFQPAERRQEPITRVFRQRKMCVELRKLELEVILHGFN